MDIKTIIDKLMAEQDAETLFRTILSYPRAVITELAADDVFREKILKLMKENPKIERKIHLEESALVAQYGEENLDKMRQEKFKDHV